MLILFFICLATYAIMLCRGLMLINSVLFWILLLSFLFSCIFTEKSTNHRTNKDKQSYLLNKATINPAVPESWNCQEILNLDILILGDFRHSGLSSTQEGCGPKEESGVPHSLILDSSIIVDFNRTVSPFNRLNWTVERRVQCGKGFQVLLNPGWGSVEFPPRCSLGCCSTADSPVSSSSVVSNNWCRCQSSHDSQLTSW